MQPENTAIARPPGRPGPPHRFRRSSLDFGFRWVHIDVDFAAGQVEEQQHHRVDGWRQNVAISLGDGVLDEAVADQASVDEDINRIAVEFLDFRFGDETVQAEFAKGWGRFCSFFACYPWLRLLAAPRWGLRQADAFQRLQGGDGNQLVQNLFSENLVHALAVTRYRRRYQHGVGGGVQLEMLVGMGQGVVRDQRRDVREFGGFGLQELLPGRNIKEKIADGDAGSGGQAGFFYCEYLAAVDFNHRA